MAPLPAPDGLPGDPEALLAHLANQMQLLACIHWLCKLRVLSCISLRGSVAISNVAELAHVSEDDLARVIRVAIDCGLLQEPQPGFVAHTPLSTPFVTSSSYLDAALFLSQTAAPMSLHMADATTQMPGQCAYTALRETSFAAACKQQKTLGRQWRNYCRHVIGEASPPTHLLSLAALMSFDWAALPTGSQVVDVNAASPSRAHALAQSLGALTFVVQCTDPLSERPDGLGPNMSIRQRTPGSAQTVEGAAVYIVNLPAGEWFADKDTTVRETLVADLHAHLGILRNNAKARVLVEVPWVASRDSMSQQPGGWPDGRERMRDLTLWQLGVQQDLAENELVLLISGVHGRGGRLMVCNRLQALDHAAVVFEVWFEPWASSGSARTLRASHPNYG